MVTIDECTEFIATGSPSRLVHDELEDDRRYHPNLGGITRGGLANHFPMTILALHGLGASDQEVRAFKQVWPRHRALIASASGDPAALGLVDSGTVTAQSWPQFLGQSEYLLEFRRVFQGELAGPAGLGTVTTALAVMRDGLPMGLFHPLIRLAFAVSHGDRGLIADALAYMAIRHLDLYRAPLPFAKAGAGKHSAPTRQASSVWRELASAGRWSGLALSASGATIRVCERLCEEQALHHAALPEDFVFGPSTLNARIAEIALLALRLYVHTPSLTTLHAVTSCQALAELTCRFGADREQFAALWARYWVWLTALYLEKGGPAQLPVASNETAPAESWSELAARARAIPEVHLIKMAYSCRWLDETFGPDPLYRLAVLDMLREQKAHPRFGVATTATALL